MENITIDTLIQKKRESWVSTFNELIQWNDSIEYELDAYQSTSDFSVDDDVYVETKLLQFTLQKQIKDHLLSIQNDQNLFDLWSENNPYTSFQLDHIDYNGVRYNNVAAPLEWTGDTVNSYYKDLSDTVLNWTYENLPLIRRLGIFSIDNVVDIATRGTARTLFARRYGKYTRTSKDKIRDDLADLTIKNIPPGIPTIGALIWDDQTYDISDAVAPISDLETYNKEKGTHLFLEANGYCYAKKGESFGTKLSTPHSTERA
ncbi:MAG: hypothetical protein ABW148_17540 [Sedimenticola sp.]